MKINNISKCCKPRKASNFTGNELTDNSNKPMRFKHYEQMSHEDLCAYSIKKAHSEVMNSRKNKVREALPQITAALIGTSFAIAQPGKLSDKAKTGLGYFVLYNVVSKMLDASREVVSKSKVEDKEKEEALT
jgi:hypothetical protein